MRSTFHASNSIHQSVPPVCFLIVLIVVIIELCMYRPEEQWCQFLFVSFKSRSLFLNNVNILISLNFLRLPSRQFCTRSGIKIKSEVLQRINTLVSSISKPVTYSHFLTEKETISGAVRGRSGAAPAGGGPVPAPACLWEGLPAHP